MARLARIARRAGIRRPANSRKAAKPLLATASATAVIAAACAGWLGWSWFSAAGSGSLSYSRARDAALQDGEQAIQNLSTFDYHHLSQGLKIWAGSSAGALHSDITGNMKTEEQELTSAKADSSATVMDAALTALDVRAGTATIIAAMHLVGFSPSNPPVTELCSVEATLARTASGWKPSTAPSLSCEPFTSATSPAPSGSPAPSASATPTTSPAPGSSASPGAGTSTAPGVTPSASRSG